MKIGVRLKINVTDIDKARLFAGKKGTYLNATAFIDLDEEDRFGNNGMITQDVTKEEAASGERGNILGNTTIFWRGAGLESQHTAERKRQVARGHTEVEVEDADIPF